MLRCKCLNFAIETCRLRATYGLNRNQLRCSKYKTNEMKLSTHLCHCGKAILNYNFKGLIPKYCSSCKIDSMINVVHHMCKAVNCETQGNKL